MKKYKPCCDKICSLGTCKTRDEGGCYCLCRLFDHLGQMKSILNGNTVYVHGGFVYFPEKETAKEYLNRIPEEKRNEHEQYVKTIPGMIFDIEKRIKNYEVDDEMRHM